MLTIIRLVRTVVRTVDHVLALLRKESSPILLPLLLGFMLYRH